MNKTDTKRLEKKKEALYRAEAAEEALLKVLDRIEREYEEARGKRELLEDEVGDLENAMSEKYGGGWRDEIAWR